MLVAQTSVGKGGLGLVYPSHRAVPDFVLTMILPTRYAAGEGFVFDRELSPVTDHDSITRLYQLASNPDSTILKKFNALMPVLAANVVSHKCPANKREDQFMWRVSTHIARGRL